MKRHTPPPCAPATNNVAGIVRGQLGAKSSLHNRAESIPVISKIMSMQLHTQRTGAVACAAKPTFLQRPGMSPCGPKRTCQPHSTMSRLPGHSGRWSY